MQYLILVVCGLMMGAAAQNCTCSIGNLPQCLLQNTTTASNETSPLLCVVAEVYNLVNNIAGGTLDNVLGIVVALVLIILKLLGSLGHPVSDLTDFLTNAISACNGDNPTLGNQIDTLVSRLIGLLGPVLAALSGILGSLLFRPVG